MAKMYFIGVVAPQEINDAALKWKNLMKDQFGCLVALRSPAHITLIPPFWMDEISENKLKNEMSKFSKSQTPFGIRLNNFAAFKPRVIFVDVMSSSTLQYLYSQLVQFLVAANIFPIKKDDRPFHPHVTIATRDLHKKAFHEAWETFRKKQYEASWPINSMSLLRHNQKNWDVIFTSQFGGDA